MEISDKETIISRLLSFPRSGTRNAITCSIETATKGLQLSGEIGYQTGCAYAYLALGECALYSARDGAKSGGATYAYEQFDKAKEIFSITGDQDGCMLANLYHAVCLHDLMRFSEAEAAYSETLRAAASDSVARLNGNVMIDAICGLGAIRAAQSRHGEARQYFNKALEQCAQKRNESKYAEVMYRLGSYEFICGNNSEAMQLLLRALDFATRDGEHRTAASASGTLSRLYFDSGHIKEYEHYAELSSRHSCEAARDEAGAEIKSLRSYYVKENARIIANAEQHLKERMLERNIQLEEANWQLNTIYNIGQSITALLDIGEVLRTLYTELLALMRVDSFFIAAYNRDSNSLEYQILYEDGREIEFCAEMDKTIPAGDFAYWCVYNDDTLVIDDINNKEIVYSKTQVCLASHSNGGYTGTGSPDGGTLHPMVTNASLYGSAVYTCLRTKGKLFGILCVRSKMPNTYTSHQVKLLDAVSAYVSIALDNATIYQKLDEVSKRVAELANHDTLTGIPNRRLLMELVSKAYAGALRTNSKVAFLFMDLDNFKPINDKYGHQAGDEVLKVFRDRVLGLIRSTDIFARMGGDEFVVVMTDLKISLNAGTLARKIIREVAKPIIINNANNFIGVSIGISIYPDDSRDTDVLIVMADEAMYRVKREYKNNFTFFNEMIV